MNRRRIVKLVRKHSERVLDEILYSTFCLYGERNTYFSTDGGSSYLTPLAKQLVDASISANYVIHCATSSLYVFSFRVSWYQTTIT